MANTQVSSKKKTQKSHKAFQAKLDLIKKNKMSKELLVDMYRNAYLSRKLDDAEITMKKQSKAYFQISGAGHEGILSAAAKVLKPKHDFFIPYYRDRALCTGLGVTAYEMLCQANGNIGDTASHGRQMPAHWGNVSLNIINKSSCTGTQFLQGVGVAEAGKFLEKMAKDGVDHSLEYHPDEIVYTSCGDGTTSQGEFWEALTTASVNKLPVLFMVEDNGFAISVPTFIQTPKGSISKALDDFPGLEIFECDGTCPIDSYDTMKKAEKHLRHGKGPVLVHAHVTRPYSHSLSDDHSFYRTKEELDQEAKIDVLNTYPDFLLKSGFLTDEERSAVEKKVDEEVKEAMKKAIETQWPAKETYKDHLYSMDVDPTSSDLFETEPNFSGKEDIPMAGAINSVLRTEIQKNPLMRMFGEDVADFSELHKLDDENLKGKGGVFKVTSGCQRVSKEGQVFNSPLAEANIIGRAIGMAMRGIKPVVEIQFFDYIWTAYMQLKNEMATTRYRSGGDFKCPMVVRVPIGGYLKGGSIYHSQSGESLFTHNPGIRVVFPSNALDAAGLLRTAIRCDDPVMFLEHKHLYYQGYNRCADPGEEFMIPFGKARVAKEGSDATIIAWGALVQKSIDAAKKIEAETGKTIEVIDPRTLAPFDMEAVKKSLSKTHRIMICHEEHKTSGFAGEITALINEECFEQLDAPILRVCSKDTHVAYCPGLEDVILPQVDDVYQQLKTLLEY
ncbi:MAG: dehydrogenase E1 component subunit alpha/beta [Bacteriovoracaceae bacterium]|jgi:2-oxoisovalerate dehydrogenase E1 component|nr:dehydrogenase [Halobacteriovoraceae bacterium]MDP7319010.1 dehydrogenase E1 component subunit alpha/beta [Bacteriovoracaceae bacterium]